MTKKERKIVLDLARSSAQMMRAVNLVLKAQPYSDLQTQAIGSLEDSEKLFQGAVALMVEEWGQDE